VLLQAVLGTRVETKRLDNSLNGSLVIQSLHNPAARTPDVRVLNVTLGDFTAQLSSANAIAEAVLSVQVRYRMNHHFLTHNPMLEVPKGANDFGHLIAMWETLDRVTTGSIQNRPESQRST
jgi:hypothetical protein